MRDIHGRVMRPVPSDFMIESSAADDEDDDGDLIDYDPEMPEEKFRVDRKKLEQMLLGYNVDVSETAENFFKRIMSETNTVINWPSKLKIGAKSKKDPHIKVSGLHTDIRLAKSKIYAVLDMKASKVTLKMDVAHTDHSHVIGRRGNNIQEVMKDTGCHIHFPDSNRNNPIEKSNQVSIAGQPGFVEIARAKIRGMLPLNFTFEAPIIGGLLPLPDATSVSIQAVEKHYEVKVQFRRNPKTCVTIVVVRGSETNAHRVMDATAVLVEHLTSNLNMGRVQVRTTLEVGPQHHAKVKEQTETEQIAQKTGTTIVFPDLNRFDVLSMNKSTVVISGTIEGVYFARLYLMGCLPLCLLFDLKEDHVLRDVSNLMHQLSVSISVKAKPKVPSIGVVIKGVEREAANIYEARRLLLGVEGDELPVVGDAYYAFARAGLSQNVLSLPNTCQPIAGQNFLAGSNGNSLFQSLMPTAGLSLPLTKTNSGHIGGWSHGSYSQCRQIMLPGITNQDIAINPVTVKSTYGRYTQAASSMTSASMSSERSSSLSAPSSTTSSLSSPSESPPRGSPIDTALNQQGYSSEALMELLLRRNGEIMQSQSVAFDILTTFNNRSSVSQNSFSTRSDASDCETVVPHKDKSWAESSIATTSQHSSVSTDYDRKRILAASAMKLKLDGPEVRVPTSSWSGLGFSHSMSEAALRELKDREGPFQVNGKLIFETEELDKDPWKDSNLNDCTNSGLCAAGALTAALSSGGQLTADVGVQQRKHGVDVSLGSSNYMDSASLPKVSSALMEKSMDLTDLFRTLSLSKYSALFLHQEIDLGTFLTMTDQDLKDLGITTFGARRKMLLAISSMNRQQPSGFSAAPGAERKLSTTKNSSSDSDGSPKNSSYWR